MLSKKFKNAVKLDTRRNYQLAMAVDLHPDVFSKYLNGALKSNTGDKRLLRIGKMLGLKKHEIFEKKPA